MGETKTIFIWSNDRCDNDQINHLYKKHYVEVENNGIWENGSHTCCIDCALLSGFVLRYIR